MEITITKSTEILKRLLTITENGKAGYEVLSEKTTEPILKNIFDKCCRQREEYIVQLKFQLQILGCNPKENTNRAEEIHQKWTTINALLPSPDTNTLMNACISLERSCLKMYIDALNSEFVNSHVKLLVLEGQLSGIEQTLKQFKLQMAETTACSG